VVLRSRKKTRGRNGETLSYDFIYKDANEFGWCNLMSLILTSIMGRFDVSNEKKQRCGETREREGRMGCFTQRGGGGGN
jgi:hypothetical protein